jgi:Domain of unknown function (DUF4126)
MNPVDTLALALGAGFSSGLNLYATIATLGLLQRYGVIHLPSSLAALSHPAILWLAVALYALEFLADKIPYVDTIWDAVHTLIRPPAAALLAYSAAGGAAPEWRWGAALLAGGVALTSHGTKASARCRQYRSRTVQQLDTQLRRGRACGMAHLDGHGASRRDDCDCDCASGSRSFPTLSSFSVSAAVAATRPHRVTPYAGLIVNGVGYLPPLFCKNVKTRALSLEIL